MFSFPVCLRVYEEYRVETVHSEVTELQFSRTAAALMRDKTGTASTPYLGLYYGYNIALPKI